MEREEACKEATVGGNLGGQPKPLLPSCILFLLLFVVVVAVVVAVGSLLGS
jgi:hypothetical protein